jgi:hypothetical protein
MLRQRFFTTWWRLLFFERDAFMDKESVMFPSELFREDYQGRIYGLFRELIEVVGKKVSVVKRSDRNEEYRVWRGEVHDPRKEKRVQFSFGVSENLRMGGMLKSVPFVEPDVSLRDPFEVLGPAGTSKNLVLARRAVPKVVDPDIAPYSYGIFDIRKPEALLELLRVDRERFNREVPGDLLMNHKEPIFVIVEQNWFTKFIPRLIFPRSELFKIFSGFAHHAGELAAHGRIFSITSI